MTVLHAPAVRPILVPEPTMVELRMTKYAGFWWENKLRRAGSGRSVASDEAESDARFALVELLNAWRDNSELRGRFDTREQMINVCIRRRTRDVYRRRAGRVELARDLRMLRLDEIAGEGDETHGDLIVDSCQNTEKAVLARLDMEAYALGVRQREPVTPTLTIRRVEVLRLAAEGHSNDEISAALIITIETVKSHKKKILQILEARSMTHAVHLAHLHGIFDTAAPRETIAA